MKDRIMAKQVKLPKGMDTFAFGSAKGGVAKYPWAEWLNGDLLEIERSIPADEPDAVNDKGTIVKVAPKGKRDYEVQTSAMFPKTKTAARARYKVVQMSSRDATGKKLANSIILQARDMTSEERVAEDALRAIEKAVLKLAPGTKVTTRGVGGEPVQGTIIAVKDGDASVQLDDGFTITVYARDLVS